MYPAAYTGPGTQKAKAKIKLSINVYVAYVVLKILKPQYSFNIFRLAVHSGMPS